MTKVFISYSHDSKAHRRNVLALSNRLRADGVDCYIDQYVNGSPAEGWQRWMEKQIESADFVLVVCTELYLRRFRGEDREGGRGVNFEGAIISQVLYDDFQQNTKFIPVLPDDGELAHVPRILKSGSTYQFSRQYEALYRVLTNQPLASAKPLGKLKHYPTLNNCQTLNTALIHSDRLPTVKGKFFGRESELELLNNAWAGNGTRIIQFIASGGTGKTKLIRHWLDLTGPEHVIAWSFYSQGSSEDKQTSATPFFSHVFEVLNAEKRLETDFSSLEAKGEYLAKLLNQQRCVLVLDGLEPMQYADKANRGELKDRALRALLKNLAGTSTGLCIVTTRIAVHELCDRAHVISHNLHNLALEDGVQLLHSLGVKGRKAELEQAVTEYGCHALALSLLGNLLRIRYQGDVHKRLTLKSLVTTSKTKENQHAFKVMQAYAEYFAGQTELALLSLLGLFDHPIEIEVLRVLWEAQIPELTAGIDEGNNWWEAIESLRHEYQLLAERVGGEELDCHPLIREYFGKRLEEEQPEVWRQAHAWLYAYYKNLPEKEFPDTLEEMQPLFHAVVHGCRARFYQKTLDDVFWPRIMRKQKFFLFRKLGAFSDSIVILANYLDKSSDRISEGSLTKQDSSLVMNWMSSSLRSVGRLEEALHLMQLSKSIAMDIKDWSSVARGLGVICEIQLLMGEISDAKINGYRSVEFTRRTEDLFQVISKKATYAYIIYQSGDMPFARELFFEAEQLQKYDRQIHLYSLAGFYYYDFLIETEMANQILEKLKVVKDLYLSSDILNKTFFQLILGCCYLKLDRIFDANTRLEQAVSGFRTIGAKHHLPRALIARHQYYRQTQQYSKAHTDLQEVYDIAEPSGMRLYLTDYHLEMARLFITEGKEPTIKIHEHVEKAEKLINDTGYHRRDKELAELKQQIS